jgi:hypothetical protein
MCRRTRCWVTDWYFIQLWPSSKSVVCFYDHDRPQTARACECVSVSLCVREKTRQGGARRTSEASRYARRLCRLSRTSARPRDDDPSFLPMTTMRHVVRAQTPKTIWVWVCPHRRSGMPTYGSNPIDRPIETARGGGHAQPASVADAAAPARLRTEGRRHTHTCHARRRAPQVYGNCTIGRAACSRADGPTRMQPIPSLCRRVHHARVHPSILPQVVLVGPEAPQEARWPVRLVHEVGWLHG